MTYTVCFKHKRYAQFENQEQICNCPLMTNKYPNKKEWEIPDHFTQVDA